MEMFRVISEGEIKYQRYCYDSYNKLLGDIKKYGLYPICDWGDIYITDLNNTRISHIDDEENIMLFNLTKGIGKKCDNMLVQNVFTEAFYGKVVRYEKLTAKELKEKLFELYGF